MRQPCARPGVASVIGGESGPCPWVHLPPERVPCPPLKPVTRLRLRLPHAVCSLPQDTVGGRFDATQAFVGELSQFNIWDRVLRAQEIIGIANCSTNMAGNIIPWVDNNVDVFGGASKWPVETCEERLLDL